MKLDMIFFDMGGTIDLYPDNKEKVKKACTQMQDILIKNGSETIKKIPGEVFMSIVLDGIDKYKQWRLTDLLELSPEELWSTFILKNINIDKNIINEKAEELTLLIDTSFVSRVAREEVVEVLKHLKEKNIRMGIISNVLSRGQVPYSLKKYGITEYFDTIVLSSVYGKRKPHPEIFYHACEKASVKPENVLYIGNSPSKDINGAISASIGRTVLIDYEHNSPLDKGLDPDFKIENLKELVSIVSSIIAEEKNSG